MSHQGRILISSLIDKPEAEYVHLRIEPTTKNLVAHFENGTEVEFAALVSHLNASMAVNVPTQVMGSSIQSVTLNWNLNKPVTRLNVAGQELDIAQRALTLNNQGISSDTNFALQAADDTESVSAYAGIHFANHRVYGVGAAGLSVANLIENGQSKDLNDGKSLEFTVNAGPGQKIYFAYPSRFGNAAFYVGGFEGGFDLRQENYANEFGFTEMYTIGETTNAGLGNTTVSAR
jgi:hypothetical protein